VQAGRQILFAPVLATTKRSGPEYNTTYKGDEIGADGVNAISATTMDGVLALVTRENGLLLTLKTQTSGAPVF